MKTVSRVLCAFICSAVAGTSLAQQSTQSTQAPPESKTQGWLLSEDPQLVAWGAHYALTTKDQALVPTLLSVADTRSSSTGAVSGEDIPESPTTDQLDRRDAMAAVLDALIQLHALVPVDSLRNLARDFPNYVAVLLARLPSEESQSLSFELYRSQRKNANSLQYVSAALLAQAPPPGFAADLFFSIHAKATISVIEPGSGGFGGGSAASCGLLGSPLPRKQWPNFGVYALSKQKTAGSFLVVSGIDPIYATRSETTHYTGNSCGMAYLGPEGRRRLLAEMLQLKPETLGWETGVEKTIEFKSEQQFYSDLQSFIAEQQEKYRVTAAALVAKNLMTSTEQPESLPHLDLYLEDRRGPDYSPITAPPLLPPNVTWCSPWR